MSPDVRAHGNFVDGIPDPTDARTARQLEIEKARRPRMAGQYHGYDWQIEDLPAWIRIRGIALPSVFYSHTL
jgi:hypothetical protein